jgi:hypothetical protein
VAPAQLRSLSTSAGGIRMTTVQRVAQLFGAGFLILGIVGFFASHTMEEAMLLGIFPVNLLHNLVHLAFGVWGLVAARSFGGARTYARITGVAYLALAVLGWIDPTGFGLVPIGGADVWLHLFIGAVLAYFGFTAREEVAAATA